MVFTKLKYLKVCKIAKIGENVLTNYANETQAWAHNWALTGLGGETFGKFVI